ncbi:hypothetical protein LSH36_393g01017 [Paralvinella palmiformis]|uniref:Uncharacterized protein n=1 Tax=Paralvinella palmiformis TaxID=53620 RepID=A0AAD9JCP2_9ANNE|nr:hypothetical protein LSH36_393g01017 [Paralvinella palmiformis]
MMYLMDTSSYISLNVSNPLCYLLGGSLCYLVSGVSVLVVGVIITSLTFQNLDHHYLANKERYAGPILICAGILIMGKGAVFHVKECQCRNALKRHWNGLCRRLVFPGVAAVCIKHPRDTQ